jgi:1-acyl-sn-glycerol-3-phosphate acyltransferase
VSDAESGELIGVFPEATMSRSLEIKELKSGAVRMAQSAEVPLIPMIVFGGHRVLSYGVKDFTRGRTICMTIGSPLEGIQDKDADAVTLQLRTRLSELLDETIARYPDKPESAPWIPKRHGGSAPTLDEAKAWEEERRARREAEKNANGS